MGPNPRVFFFPMLLCVLFDRMFVVKPFWINNLIILHWIELFESMIDIVDIVDIVVIDLRLCPFG